MARVSRQSPRVRGWLPFEKKYLHDIDLKPTEHVRNTISLELYKQGRKKKGEILIFGSFFSENFNFGLYFAENRHFQIGNVYYVIVTSYNDRFS